MSAINERFCRAGLLLGDTNISKLYASHVLVCGLGAVGGFALEALARLGVGKFTLIDFDEVRPSNANRQLMALTSTMGQNKSELYAARARDINPDCCVASRLDFIDSTTVSLISEIKPDIVIDAIDSLSSKVELLVYCRTQQIPVVSSMGAALRRDPQSIKIGTIQDASRCPLARHVRKRLKRRQISLDIPCVYSDEPLPPPSCIAPSGSISTADHLLERGRKRNVLGSLSTITGMFGLQVAHLVMEKLLQIKD